MRDFVLFFLVLTKYKIKYSKLRVYLAPGVHNLAAACILIPVHPVSEAYFRVYPLHKCLISNTENYRCENHAFPIKIKRNFMI